MKPPRISNWIFVLTTIMVVALSLVAIRAGNAAESASDAAKDASRATERAADAEARRAESRSVINEQLDIATRRSSCVTLLEARFDVYVVLYLEANAREDAEAAQAVVAEALPFMQSYEDMVRDVCFSENPPANPLEE